MSTNLCAARILFNDPSRGCCITPSAAFIRVFRITQRFEQGIGRASFIGLLIHFLWCLNGHSIGLTRFAHESVKSSL